MRDARRHSRIRTLKGSQSPPLGLRTKRYGAAAVEFALVLPVLLVLVLGCVDLARVLGVFIAVSNAARVGAEYGATHRFTNYTRASWESLLRQQSTVELQDIHGFDASQMSLTVTTANQSDGTVQVTVNVIYPFQMVSNWPGLPNEFTVQRTVVYRQFR